MSHNLFLNGATLSLSIFNAILLIWLGLTVLFNSDRRAWGIWLGSLGLLLGGAFFVSHTAILGVGLDQLSYRSLIFWWTVGLVPAVALPFAWYTVVLWYSGFWGPPPHSKLHRKQRRWFFLVMAVMVLGFFSLGLGIVLLLLPAPSLNPLRGFIRWSIAGIPMLAVGYSIYVVLCIGLSLHALRQPGPSTRVMGTLARQRAWPWLAATSIMLLLVSLLVAGVTLWIVQTARSTTLFIIYAQSAETIAWFDLAITTLIAIANVLLGQAIVSYEVFTGKTLPRRGLVRYWRQAILLAAGAGLVIGGTITIQLRPFYALFLSALLMTIFYALLSWRSYAEREQYIDQLRPFIASQRLYEQLLTHSAPAEVDVLSPFHALCHDLLDAQVAYLAALGPIAPLVGLPLTYPGHIKPVLPNLTDIAAQFHSPQTMIAPLEGQLYNGAVWAIPLWSQRGLIGVFLLGEKRNGGLYTQEEIEIARVSGERLIDTQASAEMARRLMMLQRERLAQTQVIDQQTRRVLHDDILPTLQTALIHLSSGSSQEAINQLTAAHRQISDLLHQMPTTSAPEVARLGLLAALRRTVEQEFSHAFDEVVWEVAPQTADAIAKIPTLTAEVLFYAAREAVRNAAKYGRDANSERPFYLTMRLKWQNGLAIEVEDNGIGLGTAVNGHGSKQGLALHSTMMAVVGGSLAVDSTPYQFTRVQLTLPVGG